MDEVKSVEMAKDLGVEVVPEVTKRVGKPKSEEWKRKHSEAMKLAHARKKAEKDSIKQ